MLNQGTISRVGQVKEALLSWFQGRPRNVT
jgi:hypothetical protein